MNLNWKAIHWEERSTGRNGLKTCEEIKELLPFATAWMELESILLSEIIQAVRDKYHMISPISGT